MLVDLESTSSLQTVWYCLIVTGTLRSISRRCIVVTGEILISITSNKPYCALFKIISSTLPHSFFHHFAYRYGQTKPTFCYRLLAEGSMEQKIYSRAAAKKSLFKLVIDQTNPERSFTKQEMDLLRVEDNWVACKFNVSSRIVLIN
jgi:hypothetical protein